MQIFSSTDWELELHHTKILLRIHLHASFCCLFALLNSLRLLFLAIVAMLSMASAKLAPVDKRD